ncbi:alpha/beta fold hydrolase [Nakamurella deserti]|uniref:alpha/beta fold hydrolase n=1 Tax=Nakamurella deserti TaxID=2164074 RepID=UPI000DBE7DDF|nr:alpha/beta fold hydrolase [Nakamurella deserti]
MASFVLVPGAGGDPGYWYRVVPPLTGAGHVVVAVDLPNHDGVTLTDQVDAVVAAAVSAPRPVVLVAQSMGGQLAPAVCDRMPVDALVYLNAMIPAPGETAGAWWDAVGQSDAAHAAAVRDGRDPDTDVGPEAIFFHDLPDDVVAVLAAGEGRMPPDSLFTSPQPTRTHPTVPTLVLAGRDDRLFPAELQQRVAHQRVDVDVEILPGGHLLALSQPIVLVTRLLSLLDALCDDRPRVGRVSAPAAAAESRRCR